MMSNVVNKADHAEPCLIEGVTTGHRATRSSESKAQSELTGDRERWVETSRPRG
jgi:hypothetical protein